MFVRQGISVSLDTPQIRMDEVFYFTGFAQPSIPKKVLPSHMQNIISNLHISPLSEILTQIHESHIAYIREFQTQRRMNALMVNDRGRPIRISIRPPTLRYVTGRPCNTSMLIIKRTLYSPRLTG
jgi:hypothetical protein